MELKCANCGNPIAAVGDGRVDNGIRFHSCGNLIGPQESVVAALEGVAYTTLVGAHGHYRIDKNRSAPGRIAVERIPDQG
jgi:hypothetical protein